MTPEELQKLIGNLTKELREIDKELADIASENPLVRGGFDVKVHDLGPSQEDAAQEASELDRNQALVDALQRRRRDLVNTLDKIKAGIYGKCQECSVQISPARLKAMPVAALCIICAKKGS